MAWMTGTDDNIGDIFQRLFTRTETAFGPAPHLHRGSSLVLLAFITLFLASAFTLADRSFVFFATYLPCCVLSAGVELHWVNLHSKFCRQPWNLDVQGLYNEAAHRSRSIMMPIRLAVGIYLIYEFVFESFKDAGLLDNLATGLLALYWVKLYIDRCLPSTGAGRDIKSSHMTYSGVHS